MRGAAITIRKDLNGAFAMKWPYSELGYSVVKNLKLAGRFARRGHRAVIGRPSSKISEGTPINWLWMANGRFDVRPQVSSTTPLARLGCAGTERAGRSLDYELSCKDLRRFMPRPGKQAENMFSSARTARNLIRTAGSGRNRDRLQFRLRAQLRMGGITSPFGDATANHGVGSAKRVHSPRWATRLS